MGIPLHPTIWRALLLTLVVCLASGCGNMLGPRGRSNGNVFGGGGNYGGGGGGSTATRNPTGGNGDINTNYSAELQRCDQYIGVADMVVTYCGAVFQENIDEISRGCYAAFQKLYDWECGRIESNVRNAASGCRQDIGEFWNYLPSSCRQALQRFMK